MSLKSSLTIFTLLIVFGCEKPPSKELVAIHLSSRSDLGTRAVSPYVLQSNGPREPISDRNLGIGEGVFISAKKIERRSANLVVQVGEIQHEISVNAKGTLLDLPDRGCALTFSFLSSTQPPFPADTAVSDRMIVYWLIENRAGIGVGEFHTYPISKERTGSSSQLAKHLKIVLTDDHLTGVQGADCVMAEYGISAVVDGRNIDFRFSFDCGWLYIYDGDEVYIYGFDGASAAKFREAMDLFLSGV